MTVSEDLKRYPETRRQFIDSLDIYPHTEGFRKLMLTAFENTYAAGKYDAALEIRAMYEGQRGYKKTS